MSIIYLILIHIALKGRFEIGRAVDLWQMDMLIPGVYWGAYTSWRRWQRIKEKDKKA